MKRVGMAIGQLANGGAERQLYEASKRLPDLGIQPIVYCLSETSLPYGPLLEAEGIPVRTLPRCSHFDWRRAKSLRKAVSQDRIDILHSWLIDDNPYAFFATLGAPTRFIASLRSRPLHRDPLRRILDRVVFRLADRVVANSDEVGEYLKDRYQLSASNLRVVANGIDFDRLAPQRSIREIREELETSNETFVFLFVGRLETVKRPALLIESFHLLLKSAPQPVLWLVGEGREEPSLRALANRLGIERNLRFVGAREDVGDLYRAANLLVLSSESEGLPNVVLESMACGTLALVSSGSACQELIQSGENGWICDDMTVNGFSVALKAAMHGMEALAKVEENVSISVRDRFGAGRMAETLRNLYFEVAP